MSNYYLCDYCRNCRRMVENESTGEYYVSCHGSYTPRHIVIADGRRSERELCPDFKPRAFNHA